MFEKGQIVELEIIDMSNEGQGIGKIEGLAVFVGGTVVGDKVKCRLTKIKKRYAFGEVESITQPSKWRIDSQCPHSKECGGCPFAETDYRGQLQIKEKQVRDRFERLGGLKEPKIQPIVSMENPFQYRNKATMQISTGENVKKKGGIIENLGPVAIGFNKIRSHQVVDCKDCMLQTPAAMAAAAATKEFMNEDNITAYDEKWNQGLMKSVTVRTAFGTGEVMVIYNIHGKGIPGSRKLVEMLDQWIYEAGYELKSVFTENEKGLIPIAGDQVIKEKLPMPGGCTDGCENNPGEIENDGSELNFEISPNSFYQVNPAMTIAMYDKVREYANLSGEENVLDLYCGVGSIGLWCARDAGYVVGIESVKQAVLDANRNAVINNIVNARYICGKAEEELIKLIEEETDQQLSAVAKNADVVFLDPPRAGCHPALLETVTKVEPKRIVYMSCDPATLARDIKILGEAGYEFVEATPFDNFSWTGHTECITLLMRVEEAK